MELLHLYNFGFSYAGQTECAISDITLSINSGEFITVAGNSGCGKSTLLYAVASLLPEGKIVGERKLLYKNAGYVSQSPDNCTVTDTVRHELAFAAENMGLTENAMHSVLSETAAYFGISDILDKKLSELSGGQKQTILIASAMAAKPPLLILDEPTAMLDPVAADKLISLLRRLHDETGTTIVIAEHRLSSLLKISDRLIITDGGKILHDGSPESVCRTLYNEKCDISSALPASTRMSLIISDDPVFSVSDAKREFEAYYRDNKLCDTKSRTPKAPSGNCAEISELYFSYGKNAVLKGLDLDIGKGVVTAIMGGNASGKTTLLKILNGNLKAQQGKVVVHEKTGLLTQNTDSIFTLSTLYDDLLSVSGNEETLNETAKLFGIAHLLYRHPLDLSGGEKQRAAIAKLILCGCDIFLLDEPTKGLCKKNKDILSDVLRYLTDNGKSVVLISHDMDFCAENADICVTLFDGTASDAVPPHEFFKNNSFFTTDAAKITKASDTDIITSSELIRALGGSTEKTPAKLFPEMISSTERRSIKPKKPIYKKVLTGLSVVTLIASMLINSGIFGNIIPTEPFFLPYLTVLLPLFLFIAGSFSKKPLATPAEHRKFALSELSSALIILAAAPLTVFFGEKLFGGNYMLTAFTVLFECIAVFLLSFERKKPSAKDVAVIAALCAAAIAGRELFFMFPQFKPAAAIVIISAAAVGAESGFLIGCITMLCSNLMFGQGMWTAWQMVAMGLLGCFSGLIFNRKRNMTALCIYGFISTVAVYGTIMNLSSLFTYQQSFDINIALSYMAAGLPLDVIHGIATVIFILLLARPLLASLERAKTKYGLFK